MDAYEKRKEQNKKAQQNRRMKLLAEMGNEKYHEEMARIAREGYKKRMETQRNENKNILKNKNENQIKMKISTNLYVKDYIDNIFNDFTNNIPDFKERKSNENEKAHIGIISKVRGRPPTYIIKEGMMENEKKLVEQKLKKREYQKKYMANRRQQIIIKERQKNELK